MQIVPDEGQPDVRLTIERDGKRSIEQMRIGAPRQVQRAGFGGLSRPSAPQINDINPASRRRRPAFAPATSSSAINGEPAAIRARDVSEAIQAPARGSR